ncbi:MAG: DUF3786 domain-containing protein [Nitrososphaerota archaeon]
MERIGLEGLLNKVRERPVEEIVKSCQVVYLPAREGKPERFLINLLTKSYSLNLSSGEAIDVVAEKIVDEKITRLILKYLTYPGRVKGKTGWLGIDRMPGGQQLTGDMHKRAYRPLIENFGYEPQLFETACKLLDGTKEKLGGISFSFSFFPQFKILVQLWPGDRKTYTTPVTNMMFSDNIIETFNAKDLVDASEILVLHLLKHKSRPTPRYRI